MSDHGGAPVRVLEVVADSLHVSISPDLTASVEEIAGTVVPDDGPAGVNLAHHVKHCSWSQGEGLQIKTQFEPSWNLRPGAGKIALHSPDH